MAAAYLAVAVRRRPLDHRLLSLAVLTLVVAVATVSLVVLLTNQARSPDRWTVNLSFAVATLTAVVPAVWCASLAARQGELPVEPAHILLGATLLFGINRYDALVATGTIRTVFLQPLAFGGFLLVAGGRFLRRAVTRERVLLEVGVVSSITRLVGSAVDLAGAIRPVLGLVGPLVGADAVLLALPGVGAAGRRYSWLAQSAATPGLQQALDHATDLAEQTGGPAPPSFRVDRVDGSMVVAAPVVGGGHHWGTFFLVSAAPRPTLHTQRRLIELIAAELAVLTRRMRHLSRLQDTAAAAERHRIARELHDSVSQTLYSIAMVADTFPTVLEDDPTALVTRAGQIRSMTLQALDDIRVLLLEMRESALESASLGGLLEQLGAPQGRPPVVVELDITGDPDLPADVRLSAYRVAREAITNASRHAAAHRVHIRLEQRWDAVTVEIADDGDGFDPGAVAPGSHGLSIMRERAEEAGALLVIDSAPGQGARVRFTWVAPTGGG